MLTKPWQQENFTVHTGCPNAMGQYIIRDPRDRRVLYDKWSESSVNPYGKNIGPVAGPVQIVLNYQKVHGGHHLCK